MLVFTYGTIKYHEYVGYIEKSVPQITVWQMRFVSGVLGQVWYLIVLIPDLCLCTDFEMIVTFTTFSYTSLHFNASDTVNIRFIADHSI